MTSAAKVALKSYSVQGTLIREVNLDGIRFVFYSSPDYSEATSSLNRRNVGESVGVKIPITGYVLGLTGRKTILGRNIHIFQNRNS